MDVHVAHTLAEAVLALLGHDSPRVSVVECMNTWVTVVGGDLVPVGTDTGATVASLPVDAASRYIELRRVWWGYWMRIMDDTHELSMISAHAIAWIMPLACSEQPKPGSRKPNMRGRWTGAQNPVLKRIDGIRFYPFPLALSLSLTYAVPPLVAHWLSLCAQVLVMSNKNIPLVLRQPIFLPSERPNPIIQPPDLLQTCRPERETYLV